VVLPPLERATIEAPVVPVPPLETITPAARDAPSRPAERKPAQDSPASAPPPLPRAADPPARPPAATSPPTREPQVGRDAPKDAATPRATPFRAPPASRDADAAKDYDPTKPSVDLDAIRKRAGQIAREGSGNRALLPFPMPPVEKQKSKLESAIENARKPDCRTAYQALGLAAVVPLIANEFGEGSCRW
jgi:hypothetical protein